MSVFFKQPKAIDNVPEGNYVVQRKYDGERMQFIDRGNTGTLLNRRGANKNRMFPEFNTLAKQLPGKNIVDGEMVVFKSGIDSFKGLAERTHLKYGIQEAQKQSPATYMAFDLLKYKGQDIKQEPLKERLKELHTLPQSARFKIVTTYPKVKARQIMANKKAEGVVFKDPASLYTNTKNNDWLKLKQRREADAVVMGYNKGEGKRASSIGSVQLGVWNGKEIVHVGNAGSFKGYTNSEVRQLKQKLDAGKRVFVKVGYLKKGSNGKLVEPKVLGERTDIGIKDTHTSSIADLQSKNYIYLSKTYDKSKKAPITGTAMHVEFNNPEDIYLDNMKLAESHPIERTADIVAHEEMHNILNKEVGVEASKKYDDITYRIRFGAGSLSAPTQDAIPNLSAISGHRFGKLINKSIKEGTSINPFTNILKEREKKHAEEQLKRDIKVDRYVAGMDMVNPDEESENNLPDWGEVKSSQRIGIRFENDTGKDSQIYLGSKLKPNENTYTMKVRSSEPDKIFISNDLRGINDTTKNINAISQIIGHEELHNELMKNIGNKESGALDKIALPTVVLDNPNGTMAITNMPGKIVMPSQFEREKRKDIKKLHTLATMYDTGKDSNVKYRSPERGQRVKALAYKIQKLIQPYSSRVTVAGSIRREITPNDIDIVVIPRNKDKIIEQLSKLGYFKAQGEKQIFARIDGVDVDIYFTTPQSYGAELMTRTGPKGGNLGNRTLAKRKGYTLNQYGLYKGDRQIAGRTEKEIYEALGKKYKPPQIRGLGAKAERDYYSKQYDTNEPYKIHLSKYPIPLEALGYLVKKYGKY
jgi:hypothetical protein